MSGLDRSRSMAEGVRDRVVAAGRLAAREAEGTIVLALGRRDVARLVPGEAVLFVDLDARAAGPDARRLGQPHPEAPLARAGWRRVEVRTQRDASGIVRALRGVGEERPDASRPDLRVGAVRVRRLRDRPRAEDGVRVFVDPFWPGGVPREDPPFHEWAPDAAPSPRLRAAFGEKPASVPAFRRAYLAELRGSAKADAVGRLRSHARRGALTLVTTAEDLERSSAAVLAQAVSVHHTPRHTGRIPRIPGGRPPPRRGGGERGRRPGG